MSLFNEDELVAPAWINQKFLETVLVKYEKHENIEITKFDLSPASMKGDHYASVMFRCRVDYRYANNPTSRPMSMIIKTLPLGDNIKSEMLMESKVFETEIEMYTRTLPKIEKILAECGEPTKLSAKIIYHSLEPYKVIILEDLCESGYDTVRGRFLTEDEIKGVYTKLAKLHAVSYMLGHSEDHQLVSEYQDGFMNMSMPMFKDMISNGLRNFIKMLSSHEEFGVYEQKIKDMQDVVEKECKKLFRAYALHNGKGDIFVLNHGDFHMKNLMFKFNEANRLEDLIMVDYQISCYAPSTIDLVYSQFLMLSPDLRLRRHEFMQYYFSEFIRILEKIHYQGELPKYSEFQIAGLKYRHFTIFMQTVMFPMIAGFMHKTAEDLKEIDTNEMIENPDTIAANYSIPIVVEDARNFLPILLREGYLD